MFRDLSYLDEDKVCSHCQQTLSICEAPPIHIGDGLGWGSDVLFICLNDECSIFLNGWAKIEAQYGHHASYRYMELPGSKEKNYMMVANADAFKACVVNKQDLREQNERYRIEKEATASLETCVEKNDLKPVLMLILDDAARRSSREKALECCLELNNLTAIDPLRNHKYIDPAFTHKVNETITELLKTNFKKECPYCSEIVKAQAKKCMHCKEDL